MTKLFPSVSISGRKYMAREYVIHDQPLSSARTVVQIYGTSKQEHYVIERQETRSTAPRSRLVERPEAGRILMVAFQEGKMIEKRLIDHNGVRWGAVRHWMPKRSSFL